MRCYKLPGSNEVNPVGHNDFAELGVRATEAACEWVYLGHAR